MSSGRGRFPLIPIQQVDVYASVLEQLSKQIEQGGYAPGDRLPSERDLAEGLGVSRIAVREALKALESSGRVSIRRGAGTFVVYPGRDQMAALLLQGRELNQAFLTELIDVRAAVEDRIVTLAARRASEQDIEKLRSVLRRNEAEHLRDPEPGSLNLLFEAGLARVARNRLLATVQHTVHELWVESWGKLGLAPDRKDVLHAEHMIILDAISAGDPAAARAAMSAHVDREIAGDRPAATDAGAPTAQTSSTPEGDPPCA